MEPKPSVSYQMPPWAAPIEEFFESHLDDSEINVKILKAEVIDKEGRTIYILLGYEVAEPIDAYAVLPFNIED